MAAGGSSVGLPRYALHRTLAGVERAHPARGFHALDHALASSAQLLAAIGVGERDINAIGDGVPGDAGLVGGAEAAAVEVVVDGGAGGGG